MAGQFGTAPRRGSLLTLGIGPAMYCLGAMLATLPAAGALAQEASMAQPVCLLSEYAEGETTAEADGLAPVLIAECGGTGINLGELDRYSASLNLELGAMVVEVERLGYARVILLQRGASGRVEVEDLTGALLAASGLSPSNRLGDGEADVSGFARDGSIALALGVGRGQYAGATARRFDVAEHIRQARERTSAILAEQAGEAQ